MTQPSVRGSVVSLSDRLLRLSGRHAQSSGQPSMSFFQQLLFFSEITARTFPALFYSFIQPLSFHEEYGGAMSLFIFGSRADQSSSARRSFIFMRPIATHSSRSHPREARTFPRSAHLPGRGPVTHASGDPNSGHHRSINFAFGQNFL